MIPSLTDRIMDVTVILNQIPPVPVFWNIRPPPVSLLWDTALESTGFWSHFVCQSCRLFPDILLIRSLIKGKLYFLSACRARSRMRQSPPSTSFSVPPSHRACTLMGPENFPIKPLPLPLWKSADIYTFRNHFLLRLSITPTVCSGPPLSGLCSCVSPYTAVCRFWSCGTVMCNHCGCGNTDRP